MVEVLDSWKFYSLKVILSDQELPSKELLSSFPKHEFDAFTSWKILPISAMFEPTLNEYNIGYSF